MTKLNLFYVRWTIVPFTDLCIDESDTVSACANFSSTCSFAAMGSLYTCVTNDYEKRFAEHADGIDASCYTFRRRPLQLVYIAAFREVTDAIAFEKQVKGWSRKKKEALIGREYEVLPNMSLNMMQRRILYTQKHTRHRVIVRTLEL